MRCFRSIPTNRTTSRSYAIVTALWFCALCTVGAAQQNASDERSEPSRNPAGDTGNTLPSTPLEARIEFERLIEAGDYSAAVAVGQRQLELTIAEFGETSVEAGRALYALAEAQRNAEHYDDAELNYLSSIETMRSVDGQFSELTIAPSIGLGDAYLDGGQYMNAVTAYNEARTLQRRVFGLLYEEQIAVMDRMTEAFQSMAMYTEADEQQREALTLVERIHGLDSIEMLQAIYKYARWLRSAYRFFEEREQYERAIRMIRAEHGKDHPLLVEPWREIGNSYRIQALEDPRGYSTLNSARELLLSQPETDPLELARTLTDIGDWLTAFGPTGSGFEEYRRAWGVLASVPQGEALREEWFQSPRPPMVLVQSMSVRGLAQNPGDPDAQDGHVLLRFDVDPYGRTENVEVLESVPPGFKDEAAARSIRQSRFRPRISGDEFVYSRGRGYRITFRYIPDDVE